MDLIYNPYCPLLVSFWHSVLYLAVLPKMDLNGTCNLTSIIFLFVAHPFDAGDRIIFEGNTMVVEKVSILQTVFAFDGQKIYMPNSIHGLNLVELAHKRIINIRRSGDMNDYVNFKVDIKTPEETIKAIHIKILEFLRSNTKILKSDCMYDIITIEDRMITIRVQIPYIGNWQDGLKRWTTRTKFMFALKKILVDFEIEFVIPTQHIRIIDP